MLSRWAALGAIVVVVVGSATGVYLRAVHAEMRDAKSYYLTLMELRRGALESYLSTIRSEVLLWSARPTLRVALQELEQAWDELPGDRTSLLQGLYIDENPFQPHERHRLLTAGDGSRYSGVHARVHPRARRFLEQHGYYDVFLFNPEGDLIYTAFKERDFATNLEAGPWRETALGKAFRAARDAESPDFVVFTDFEPYEPSNGEPAAFVASPVRAEDGSLAGVLAFQVPIDRIDRIMQFTGGMGESGETYIVGVDRLMRSDSRFADESTILRVTVDTETVGRALAGETGVDVVDDYRGVSVLSAYGPLAFEGVRWAVMAEIDERELRQQALEPRRLFASMLLVLAGIGAFMALLLTYLMGREARPEPWTKGV
ncbi:MAG: cache domain-containing protein [Gemmatimonadales bacterium]